MSELTPLGQIERRLFFAPTNSAHLLFAYYESSLVVEFIVTVSDWTRLKKILGDLRDGKETTKPSPRTRLCCLNWKSNLPPSRAIALINLHGRRHHEAAGDSFGKRFVPRGGGTSEHLL